MQSTTSPAARNLCTRCATASQAERAFCDCTRPVCADCSAIPSERDLSWEGVVNGRDVWLCAGCSETRSDEAAIENAIEMKEAAE